MRRVDADLEGLQPVAMPQALEGEAVAGRRDEGSRTPAARAASTPRRRARRTARRRAPAADSCAGARAGTACEPTGSAGVSRQPPSAANFQPWNGQRRPSSSQRPNARSAPRCGQARSSRPKRPAPSRNSTRSSPSTRTALTGRAAPCAGRGAGRTRRAAPPAASSCASARRKRVPGPMRVISSFCSACMSACSLQVRRSLSKCTSATVLVNESSCHRGSKAPAWFTARKQSHARLRDLSRIPPATRRIAPRNPSKRKSACYAPRPFSVRSTAASFPSPPARRSTRRPRPRQRPPRSSPASRPRSLRRRTAPSLDIAPSATWAPASSARDPHRRSARRRGRLRLLRLRLAGHDLRPLIGTARPRRQAGLFSQGRTARAFRAYAGDLADSEESA